MSRTAVIVDVVRTPLGKRNGRLKDWHPADLAALTLAALATRNGLDPARVDDVIMGCVTQSGEQAVNIGRNAVLAAGWPESVPSTTIDRQSGSGQQALHFAAQGVMAGAYDIVIAAGVESMSRVPLGASVANALRQSPYPASVIDRYTAVGGMQPSGIGAELIADKWAISRDDGDALAYESHRRAAAAIVEGRFEREIVAVAPIGPRRADNRAGASARSAAMTVDECVRHDSTNDAFVKAKPAYKQGGTVTAVNSGQISDGAAAALIMSEAMCEQLGFVPRARFRSFALGGTGALDLTTATIPATERALARAGLSIGDIDVIEINETFAPIVLAWASEIHPDMARVNRNGGAIALGHPIGCSGVRMLATLVNELERSNGRLGLQTTCDGDGTAAAMIVERP